MSKRFTLTDKWDNAWFRHLPHREKVMYSYINDKCDLAGFWKIDFEVSSMFTRIPEEDGAEVLGGLSEAYAQVGDLIWMENFIADQGNLPLNPSNNAHRHIITILLSHPEFYEFYTETIRGCLGANKPPCKSKSISISKGKSKGKSKEAAQKKKVITELFNTFYDKYPRQKARGDALRAWHTHIKTEAMGKVAIGAIVRQRLPGGGMDGDINYLVYPAKWIRDGRWEDGPDKDDRKRQKEARDIPCPCGNKVTLRSTINPTNLCSVCLEVERSKRNDGALNPPASEA